MDNTKSRPTSQSSQQEVLEGAVDDPPLAPEEKNPGGSRDGSEEAGGTKATKTGALHAASIAIGIFGSSFGGTLIGYAMSAPLGPSWPFYVGLISLCLGALSSVLAVHFSEKSNRLNEGRFINALATLQDSINDLETKHAASKQEFTEVVQSLQRAGRQLEQEGPLAENRKAGDFPQQGLRGWGRLKVDMKRLLCS